MKLRIILISLLFTPLAALAWEGVDVEKGTSVEIERGNLVRPGSDIEIYDHASGRYRDVEVESIRRYGSQVEIEVRDNSTGETSTLEMDDR